MGLSAATALVAATGAVSSFAWFAVNSSVTATGMKIKADSTNAFLEIKKNGAKWPDSGSQTSVTIDSKASVLSPTHLATYTSDTKIAKDSMKAYQNGTNVHTWVSAVSDDADSALSGITQYDNVTTDADNGTKYTLLTTFDLRLRYTEANASKKYTLKAAISWSSATSQDNDALANAARVFMVVGTENNENISAQNAGYVFNARTNTGWNAAGSATNTIDILKDFTSDVGKLGRSVSLYYYFDGEDAACTTKKAETNSEFSITATFSVTEQTA